MHFGEPMGIDIVIVQPANIEKAKKQFAQVNRLRRRQKYWQPPFKRMATSVAVLFRGRSIPGSVHYGNRFAKAISNEMAARRQLSAIYHSTDRARRVRQTHVVGSEQ